MPKNWFYWMYASLALCLYVLSLPPHTGRGAVGDVIALVCLFFDIGMLWSEGWYYRG